MIEAKFRIVTPLFMGGEDQNKPELRVPGIKGALRFWWRALAWNWCKGDLKSIRDLEGEIFGSTKDGQSRVIMDLCEANAESTNEIFFKRRQGLMYLGYGPIDKGKLTRDYLKQPVDATLRIRIRPKDGKAPDESVIADQISKALIAMGYFGGLGSRSRRGFGSFNLIELNVDGQTKFNCPTSKDQLKEAIQEFIKDLDMYNGLPEYTAFSQKTEFYLFKDMSADPLDLLDGVGKAMIEYRLGVRRRRSGRTVVQTSGFENDTALSRNALNSQVNEHPRRLFFGLPHNYHFKNSNRNLEIRGEKHDRRASPLLIHVQMVGKEYAAVAALMPARFLPSGEKILMKATEEKNAHTGTLSAGHSSSLPKSCVDLDAEEAEKLTVIKGFLESGRFSDLEAKRLRSSR